MPRGKYGRLPHDPARASIAFADVATGVVPDHPAAVDYLANLSGWQMLGNDEYGTCVAVTWANVRRLITATLSTEAYPSLQQVIDLYRTQNPGFPSQDDGMVIQKCLELLVKHGGPDGVKAVAFAKVDHTKPDEVKAAVATFGYLWVGTDVLAANEDEFDQGQPWDYVPGSPDVGGHSVLSGGYDADGHGGDETFITWATETSFTDRGWQKLVKEAWVVIWPEHLGTRAFPEGVDLAKLAAAYEALTGRVLPFQPPTPAPTPPVPPPAPVVVDPRLVQARDLLTAVIDGA